MDNLSSVESNESYQLLSRVAKSGVQIHLKEQENEKIIKTTLKKNIARKQFFIDSKDLGFDKSRSVTFKIIMDRKLYFLKTTVKKTNSEYYFENIDHMFELVRRKKPRYIVPAHWAQIAKIQAANKPIELKSPSTILDISRTGMRLYVRADLPRYEKNQTINLFFKIYRRAEILVKSKIIHIQHSAGGAGPIIGLEFSDNSALITNKLQNVCDDLAFYWTSEIEIQHQK